jgi:hypothetical protein
MSAITITRGLIRTLQLGECEQNTKQSPNIRAQLQTSKSHYVNSRAAAALPIVLGLCLTCHPFPSVTLSCHLVVAARNCAIRGGICKLFIPEKLNFKKLTSNEFTELETIRYGRIIYNFSS